MLLAGAVLCGGASTRMGRDKALLVAGDDGVPMAAIVAAALAGAGADPVWAVGGNGSALLGLGPVGAGSVGMVPIADDHPGEGPLGGIITGLRRADALGVDVLAVLACDMPGATAEAVERVVQGLWADPAGGAAFAEVEGRPEALFAAWRVSAMGELVGAFSRGERSVRNVLPLLSAVAVHGLPASVFRNVNTPADLRR